MVRHAPSLSSGAPGAWAPARWPSPSGGASRHRAARGRRRPRPAPRWSRGDRRRRAPARAAVGRPARGPRADPARPPPRVAARRRRVPRPLGEGGATTPPSERAVVDVLGTLRTSDARVVLDVPASSPLLPGLLAAHALVVLLVALRTRGLADADAAVQRMLRSPTRPTLSTGACPRKQGQSRGPARGPQPRLDLRLVTRGPPRGCSRRRRRGRPPRRPTPPPPARRPGVARDAERGLFPGAAPGRGPPLRRCGGRPRRQLARWPRERADSAPSETTSTARSASGSPPTPTAIAQTRRGTHGDARVPRDARQRCQR